MVYTRFRALCATNSRTSIRFRCLSRARSGLKWCTQHIIYFSWVLYVNLSNDYIWEHIYGLELGGKTLIVECISYTISHIFDGYALARRWWQIINNHFMRRISAVWWTRVLKSLKEAWSGKMFFMYTQQIFQSKSNTITIVFCGKNYN